jgi:hypothetical protein
MKSLQKQKNLVLLLLMVAGLMVQPLAPRSFSGLVFFDVLLTALLIAVFLIIFKGRRERFVALIIGLAALASNWAVYGIAGDLRVVALVIRHVLVIVFLGFAVTVILRDLARQRTIRIDHVIGAFCGYLLAGLAWGNLYLLAEDLAPGSYSVKAELVWQLKEEHTRRSLFNYFSFVTLTTLGYGDITPIRPFASTLAWIEAVFGQFYVAVVVAQLVGLSLAQAIHKEEARQD